MDPLNVDAYNVKFVALRVPEIIWVLQKFGKSLDRPTDPRCTVVFSMPVRLLIRYFTMACSAK